MLKAGMLPRERIETRPREYAELGIGERGYGVGAAGPKGPADEIGGKGNADDQFATVSGRRSQFEHAVDHIGDYGRVVALPNNRFAAAHFLAAPDAVQFIQAICFEYGADGSITDKAGVASGHRTGLDEEIA